MYAVTWICLNCGEHHQSILSLGELETLAVLGAVESATVLPGVN
jgi:hypothetical protein